MTQKRQEDKDVVVASITKSRADHSNKVTKLDDGSGSGGIKVVSGQKVTASPEGYARLKNRFKELEKAKQDEIRGAEEDEKKLRRPYLSDEKRSRIILVTRFNVFMYAFCFFVQTGSLPYLTKKLGADPVTFGYLQTLFAVAQLLGGPVYGRLGDLFGERLALMVAFTASILTYGLTGLSASLPFLFLSRLPSVFMHVMQGSQMIVTSLSAEADRASSLARLYFFYGLGMVVGPTLGGVVTARMGEEAASLLAAVGCVFSLALVYLYVPHIPKQSLDKSSASVLNVKAILKLALIPSAAKFLLLKTVCGIPIGVLQSMFSVIAMEKFKLPADKNGLMLSYIGAISLVMQGIGIKLFTSRFSDTTLLKFSAFSLTLSYFALSLLTGLTDFILLLMPLVSSLCLINSIVSSSLTKVVAKEQTGQMLGLNMAVHSTIRSLSPSVGGWMLANYGFPSIGHLGVVCNLAVLFLLKFLSFED